MSPCSYACALAGRILFGSRSLFCSMNGRAVSTIPSLERKFSSSWRWVTLG